MTDPSTEHNTKSIGKSMAIIAWIVGMVLLTQLFGLWEKNQINPNRDPVSSTHATGTTTVSLKRNRYGHYLTAGAINNTHTTFLLDTGATQVVVPESLAESLKLPRQGYTTVQTANGQVQAIQTTIATLSIGDIRLYNVRAIINPAMNKNDETLLGMSVLKQLDFHQEGQYLTLTQQSR
ncbi:retropepsin-like aspartic protease family protein [Oleiphilus messinensis]|nr:TIGR02281 family clan AA aspartic protease [Oleiphilus messinensis]